MIKRSVPEQNRASWNAVTDAHNSHKADQDRFLREGGCWLHPEEKERLAPLKGASVLHLQCNCGQDTLSLVNAGATAVGVDISDNAVAFAQKLSADSGVLAQFERAEVIEWLEAHQHGERLFDRVFSSYGAIPWLENLERWARGIAGVLAPGGRFVLVEFHPAIWTFDEQGAPQDSYFCVGPEELAEGVTDYVGASGEGLTRSGRREGVKDFKNPESAILYQHTPGNVVTALAKAGLFIEELTEFPHCNGFRPSPAYEAIETSVFRPGPKLPSHPCMFAVVASRRE